MSNKRPVTEYILLFDEVKLFLEAPGLGTMFGGCGCLYLLRNKGLL